jgi:methylated-DNA-protein-cysteine methyltransferase-like protein
MSELEDRIVAVVCGVPVGDVTTYGEVAAEAGSPRAARVVGRVLATTGEELPWWRVVNAAGRLAPGKEDDQARRLRAEGIEIRGGHVVGMRRRR